jgi:hypothetical protein
LQEAYETVIFQDFSFAQENDVVETRMWLNSHHRIIEQYRKNITHFQEQYGKKRPVELRKLQDRFVGFIKQTTRFYRSFIQRLISHFQINELEWVVSKFHLSSVFTPSYCKLHAFVLMDGSQQAGCNHTM